MPFAMGSVAAAGAMPPIRRGDSLDVSAPAAAREAAQSQRAASKLDEASVSRYASGVFARLPRTGRVCGALRYLDILSRHSYDFYPAL